MKKKILMTVYDMEIGGVERSLINMLEKLDYEKIEVDLLVCAHRGDFMKLIPRQVNLLPEDGRYSVFRRSLKQCFREMRFAAVFIRLLARVIGDLLAWRWKLKEGSGYVQLQLVSNFLSYFLPALPQRYDCAVSYAWPHDLVIRKVKADRKVAWIHTDYSKLEIDHKRDFAMWSCYDAIAAVSEACAETFVEQYPQLAEKTTIIENLTSPAFIRSMAEDPIPSDELDNCDFNIVSVGRLSYVKGFDMAIDALALLKKKGYAGMKWRVVGYGGSEAELRERISRRGLQDSFLLLGKKTNPYPYVRASDLYVQPSRYEGKAVTITEAQILGKPVLITDYPTARSQVEEGIDGVICEISAEAIAEAIERLYVNSALRSTLSANLAKRDYENTGELAKLYRIIGEGDARERRTVYERSIRSSPHAEGERHHSRL